MSTRSFREFRTCSSDTLSFVDGLLGDPPHNTQADGVLHELHFPAIQLSKPHIRQSQPPFHLPDLSLTIQFPTMSVMASLLDFPDLPSGLASHTPAVGSGLSANVNELASAFQTVASPLLSSLPKRIVVDQKNGDLYASKSSEAMKTRGWSFFEKEQQEVLAERVTTCVHLSIALFIPACSRH